MTVDMSPAERRRGKVRGKILIAAERVLAQEGQIGLSIRRLAEEIDYSPAAIYKYFDSKESLVDELKESFFSRLLEELDACWDLTLPFSVWARRGISTYIRTAVDKPHHYAAAFSGQFVGPDPEDDDPDFIAANKRRAFAYLRQMVQQGVDLGEFRPDIDASLAAKSIWASSHGLASMIIHIPTFPCFEKSSASLSKEKFIDLHADQLIRGLEKSS